MSGIQVETPRIEVEDAVAEQPQPETAQHQLATVLPLLLEVGCEEIPARFLRDAERSLGERVEVALFDARLIQPSEIRVDSEPTPSVGAAVEVSPPRDQAAKVTTYSTPRRLVVHVPAVLVQQPDKVEEVLGPPAKVAIDGKGNYTRAAQSFAQKNAAGLDELTRVTTPKGEYLALRKTTSGRPAVEILAEILPVAILGLSFPKSMYWTEKSAPRFVRPIRWLLAILGEGGQAAIVNFEILGVKSGNFTFGHRVKGSQPISVSSVREYSNRLTQAFVEIEPGKRLDRVREEAQALAAGPSLKLLPDDWLADWIVNATEWPRPMLGSFDARFLHLPREILITVMRDHQRYFAVEQVAPAVGGSNAPSKEAEDQTAASRPLDEATLAPHFVAVLNMDSDEKGLIRQGHERVLTARFRDAEFFWNADQKLPLRDRVALLEKVTYQAKLGSYGNKIRRVGRIAETICATLEAAGLLKDGQRQHVVRAVELCKCDLTTQMVQEFTELQGIVGGLYAKVQGEPREVADAIYDHYLPSGAEGSSPRTVVGALVSVADKLDSVVAGFAVGNEPTGSSDPFALRRQANGIIRILVEFSLPLTFVELVESARAALEREREGMLKLVLGFLDERLRFYLETVGRCRYDSARAVMAEALFTTASDALARARAIESVRDTDDYLALAAAAKRTRNILKKSANPEEFKMGGVDRALLREDAELELYRAFEAVLQRVGGTAAEGTGERNAPQDYEAILTVTAGLRPQIDRFFDKVLVMHQDPAIRKNRLILLRLLETQVFRRVGDLSEIEGHVDALTL